MFLRRGRNDLLAKNTMFKKVITIYRKVDQNKLAYTYLELLLYGKKINLFRENTSKPV